MSYGREWFIYAGSPGNEQVSTNYWYVPYFPTCQTTGALICSVKGIYDYETYGYHPAPFSLDTRIEDYITAALAADVAYPVNPPFKPYVYVKSI
jgi:hypothetical protein